MPDMIDFDDPQLTFIVDLHRDLREHDDPLLVGTLAIKGRFTIERDLQAGEAMTVTATDADGNVIATSRALVAYPAFKDIRDSGVIIGTERVHTAELAP